MLAPPSWLSESAALGFLLAGLIACGAGVGDWPISVTITDVLGNRSTFTSAQVQALGLKSYIRIAT
jgi:hypothetical protein